MKDVILGLAKRSFSASLVALAVAFLASQAVLAGVTNISTELFQQYGKDAYWEVNVSCEGDATPRTMQRRIDLADWCGKDISGFCADNKNAAAEAVCSVDYSLTLADLKEQQRQQQAIANERKAQQAKQAKERAAKQAENSRKAAQAKNAEQTTLQNNIILEEQSLKIEQEKLALRRRQLELQRRAVELEELLKE